MGKLTCMGIRNRHFPNTHMAKHTGHKLAKSQGNDQFPVVIPGNVHVLPNAPQVKKGSTENSDTEQLDHGHGQRIWKLVKNSFTNNIVR